MTHNLLKKALMTLLTLLLLTGGAHAVDVTVSGSLSVGSPTFNRTSDRAGYTPSANTVLPYEVIEIRTGSTGGALTATVGGATQFDSFLALYPSFAPGSPQANILAADDDGAGYPHARLSAVGLAANTSYFLVVSSYSSNTDGAFPLYGSYGLTISGDLASFVVTTAASPSAGGTVSCTSNPVIYGGSSTCTASANTGYTFGSFSGDCSGVSCVLSNVTTAKSVTASFTQDTHAITATASPLTGGSVNCAPNPVPHGGGTTCTASANTGYTFGSFSGDCSGVSCVLSNVTTAKSVTASFTQYTHAITATASPLTGGTVSCAPNPVPHGGGTTCTANANAGYNLAAFSGDCTGATCLLSNVTVAKAVTANFVVNAAPTASAVTINGTPQVNVQLTGSYTYADAESNPQGMSTFRWMVDTKTSGATKAALAGATSTTYTAAAAVEGKYLFFCVTPIASAGSLTGSEVCSAASTVVAAAAIAPPPPPAPLIPPLGGIVPGLGSGPMLLDMTGGSGSTIAIDVVRALEKVVVPGIRYVGQSSSGAMIMSTPGGQNVVAAPIAVQANDPRPDGLYPVGNGQYQIVANGVVLTVAPVVQNLSQLVGRLPVGASVTMGNNGVLVAKVDGVTYVVQPSVFAQLVANPEGVPTLLFGADGYLHFTDAAGNSQTLYPTFAEVDVLLRTLQSLDVNATVRIQLDGTAAVRFQGQDLVLVPDLTLGGVPADQMSSYWWQEGPRRYRLRLQSNWFDYLSQGLTLR